MLLRHWLECTSITADCKIATFQVTSWVCSTLMCTDLRRFKARGSVDRFGAHKISATELAIRETNNFRPAPCTITLVDASEGEAAGIIDGRYALGFYGNVADLTAGAVDLESWRHFNGRRCKTVKYVTS